jgi:hypothetical protein
MGCISVDVRYSLQCNQLPGYLDWTAQCIEPEPEWWTSFTRLLLLLLLFLHRLEKSEEPSDLTSW